MARRAVLKTVAPQGVEGSIPSSSAGVASPYSVVKVNGVYWQNLYKVAYLGVPLPGEQAKRKSLADHQAQLLNEAFQRGRSR